MTAGVDFIITDNASQANDRASITQTIQTSLSIQTQWFRDVVVMWNVHILQENEMSTDDMQ